MEATTENTENTDAPGNIPPPQPVPDLARRVRRRDRIAYGTIIAAVALVIGTAIGAVAQDDGPAQTVSEVSPSLARSLRLGAYDEGYDEGRADANADHLDALETARTEGYEAGYTAAEGDAATAAAEAQAAEEQAAAEAAAAEAARGVGPGTLVVGTDIAPGRYTTTAGSDIMGSCYWARLSDVSGDFEAIITNGNAQGVTTVEIAPTDVAFETDCTWQPAG